MAGPVSSGAVGKRKVMVIADPGRESAGALEWALYHAVLEHDEIILLHVEAVSRRATTLSNLLRHPPSSVGAAAPGLPYGTGGALAAEDGQEYEFLDALRAKCEAAQPTVSVQVERVEMDCKGKVATIMLWTNLYDVDLLVVGQRKNPSSFLRSKLSGSTSSKGTDPSEFLIENSRCLCVGVQKKGQNSGFVLNTKTHKNFWLLA